MPVSMFLISTLLPGTTAPLGSVIFPVSDPRNSWAVAGKAARMRSKPAQKTRPFAFAIVITLLSIMATAGNAARRLNLGHWYDQDSTRLVIRFSRRRILP